MTDIKKEVKLTPILWVAFLNETAYSMMWPLATIYINTILHKSLTVAGTALLWFSLANVLGSVVAGKLYDKYNQFKLTVFGTILSIIICSFGIFYDGWPTYAIILAAFGFSTGWLTTAVNVYATFITDKASSKVFNELYLVLNVGLVLGTMLISEIFHKSIAPIFILVTSFYIISLITLIILFPKHELEYGKIKAHDDIKIEAVKNSSKTKPSQLFAVSFITLVIMWTMYSQWESNFSVYLIDNGFSMHVYSFLWVLNGIVIILVQGILAHWPHLIRSLFNRVTIGLAFLSISYFVTVSSKNVLFIYLGMILLTIGEAIYVPSVPVIVDDWSSPDVKGRNQGLVSGFSSVGRAIGPLFGGLIIDHSSFRVLFMVAGVSMLLITLVNYLVNLRYRKV